MSDSASSRRPQGTARGVRTPLFELQERRLPSPPQPLWKQRDPFEDLPELRPRIGRRPTAVPPPGPLAAHALTASEELIAPAPVAHSPLLEAAADLHRAQLMMSRPAAAARPIIAYPAPRRSLGDLFQDHPWLLLAIAATCVAIILLTSAPTRTVISRYRGQLETTVSHQVDATIAASTPPGQHSVLGNPTISAEQIDAVLTHYGSPAAGTGQIWIEMGKRYGIDPAYALAFFIHESSAGTNPGWAGLKPGGGTTHNIGNIICAGYPTCFGRFRDYANWDEGIEDWFKLIRREYVGDRGIHTVEQIIPIYAPASDNNDPANYIRVVVSLVEQWRQGVQ